MELQLGLVLGLVSGFGRVFSGAGRLDTCAFNTDVLSKVRVKVKIRVNIAGGLSVKHFALQYWHGPMYCVTDW